MNDSNRGVMSLPHSQFKFNISKLLKKYSLHGEKDNECVR